MLSPGSAEVILQSSLRISLCALELLCQHSVRNLSDMYPLLVLVESEAIAGVYLHSYTSSKRNGLLLPHACFCSRHIVRGLRDLF